MSVFNAGDVAAGSTIQIAFATFNSAGASANRTTAGTVRIYKDGGTTERSSANGISDVNAPNGFDSVTGLNLVSIDLSDNTDAGFYAAGHNYTVMVSGAVVDSQTVNPWIGSFSIQNRPVFVSPGTGTGQINLASGAVPIQAGTGTGQLDFTSGVVKANLAQILGTALTETAGQIAAGFKKVFDVLTPVFTAASVNQTGDAFARIGAAGAGLTALGDTRIANLDATVSSRTKPADTQAAVTTVTNLTNAPTAGDFNATMKTSLNAATPAVTVSDKTGFSLSAAGVQAIWDALTSALTTVGSIGKLISTNLDALISSRTKPADTQAAVTLVATTTNLTNAPPDSAGVTTLLGRLTALRAGYLDVLNGIVAAIWAAVVDSGGVTTLLARLTATRAGLLDNLDAAISSRLASASYTAPLNSTQAAQAVLNAVAASYNAAGSIGQKINASGAAADPLLNPVPGSYAAGTAGWEIGQLETIRDKALLITAATITFTAPVMPSTNDLVVVRGDDYTVASARPLPQWSNSDWSALSLLTATSIGFVTKDANGNRLTISATALSATQVQVTMTSAQTASLAAGTAQAYALVATLASGAVVTLARGTITAIESVR